MGVIATTRITLRDGRSCEVGSPRAGDAEVLRAGLIRAFATTDTVLTCADEFTPTQEEEARFVEARALSPTGLMVWARVEGEAGWEVAGVAGLEPLAKRRAAHNVTLGIIVDGAHRGRGVGSLLMEAMMAYARAHPLIRRVQLEVLVSNPGAIRLYERHGFVVEGRRVGCFQRVAGEYEDDLIMAASV